MRHARTDFLNGLYTVLPRKPEKKIHIYGSETLFEAMPLKGVFYAGDTVCAMNDTTVLYCHHRTDFSYIHVTSEDRKGDIEMRIEEMMKKMIGFCKGDHHDINHFMKVR